jgi:hypothetical protein
VRHGVKPHFPGEGNALFAKGAIQVAEPDFQPTSDPNVLLITRKAETQEFRKRQHNSEFYKTPLGACVWRKQKQNLLGPEARFSGSAMDVGAVFLSALEGCQQAELKLSKLGSPQGCKC